MLNQLLPARMKEDPDSTAETIFCECSINILNIGEQFVIKVFACAQNTMSYIYSGPCDLRPPILPTKYGLIMKVVL